VDHQARVELTRRGEPVAVLVSIREYRNLTAERRGFWPAYESFRRTIDLARLKIGRGLFKDVRERSGGREMRW
jgi:antitoxin (DNA-binding transcriptional repressor) of toxin-antitoxin stability system